MSPSLTWRLDILLLFSLSLSLSIFDQHPCYHSMAAHHHHHININNNIDDDDDDDDDFDAVTRPQRVKLWGEVMDRVERMIMCGWGEPLVGVTFDYEGELPLERDRRRVHRQFAPGGTIVGTIANEPTLEQLARRPAWEVGYVDGGTVEETLLSRASTMARWLARESKRQYRGERDNWHCHCHVYWYWADYDRRRLSRPLLLVAADRLQRSAPEPTWPRDR